MNVTLESVQAEHTRLASMIATLVKQSKTTAYVLPACEITLAPGEHYAGLIVGKDGESSYHLILLAGAEAEIKWKDAKAWAAKQGGELPTRREQALLYANLKEQFESAWYWSSEAHKSDSGYAWYQIFSSGSQYGSFESSAVRARAVRRLMLD